MRVRPIPLLVVMIVALLGTLLPTTSLASGRRPELPASAGRDRWTPPAAVVTPEFTTHPAPTAARGIWHIPPAALPLEFVVEQEVLDRFGEEPLLEALTSLNGVAGSRFEVAVVGTSSTGADARRRDSVQRVFIDRTTCQGSALGHAHLFPGDSSVVDGVQRTLLAEVDIGICERTTPEQLLGVVRHELGHTAGLGHLCGPSEPCWEPGMGRSDQACRLMATGIRSCTDIAQGDLDGLAHLHPQTPRVAGTTPAATLAAVSRVTDPALRQAELIVLIDEATPDPQAALVMAQAALRDVPVLTTPTGCQNPDVVHELNRVAALHATVLAIGQVGCVGSLTRDWELDVERVSLSALERRLRELVPPADTRPGAAWLAPRVQVYVAEESGLDALAVSAAVGADAQLHRYDARQRAHLASGPCPARVLVIGPSHRGTFDLEQAGRGCRAEVVWARTDGQIDPLETVIRRWAPALAHTIVAVPTDDPLPGALLAARLGGVVVPVDAHTPSDAALRLVSAAQSTVVVGSPSELSFAAQRQLSRIVGTAADAAP